MLFGFLQGMRKLSKIVDQGVSSLILTLNTLPAGCVFFAVAILLFFFVGGALFFVAAVGLLILKVLFKPPMPVATGFLEVGAVFFLIALQLTPRGQVVTDDGTGANAKVLCTSTTSAMMKMALLLLNDDDDIIRVVVLLLSTKYIRPTFASVLLLPFLDLILRRALSLDHGLSMSFGYEPKKILFSALFSFFFTHVRLMSAKYCVWRNIIGSIASTTTSSYF